MLMPAKRKGRVTLYFLDLLLVRYNCPKFHDCSICVTDFRKGGLFAPTSASSPEKAHPQ